MIILLNIEELKQGHLVENFNSEMVKRWLDYEAVNESLAVVHNYDFIHETGVA